MVSRTKHVHIPERKSGYGYRPACACGWSLATYFYYPSDAQRKWQDHVEEAARAEQATA